MKARPKERTDSERGRHFEVFLKSRSIGLVVPTGDQWQALAERAGKLVPLGEFCQRNAAIRELEESWKRAEKTRAERKKKG